MRKSVEKMHPEVHERASRAIMLQQGMNMNGPAPDK